MLSPRRRLLAAATATWLLPVFLSAQNPVKHVRSFAEVNKEIYRGGEPSVVGLQELGAMGIKVDLDLRESSSVTQFEKQEAQKLGMKYINVPLPPFSAPSGKQMREILAILMSANSGPVFVHCRRGKDRTGTAIACYRIQHDGWSNEAAESEAKQHGMSFAERGMRSFILHFKPISLPDLTASAKP